MARNEVKWAPLSWPLPLHPSTATCAVTAAHGRSIVIHPSTADWPGGARAPLTEEERTSSSVSLWRALDLLILHAGGAKGRGYAVDRRIAIGLLAHRAGCGAAARQRRRPTRVTSAHRPARVTTSSSTSACSQRRPACVCVCGEKERTRE